MSITQLVFGSAVLTMMCEARPEFQVRIPNGVTDHPSLGHNVKNVATAGNTDTSLNAFGIAFRNANYVWTRELCLQDSDNDGQSNGYELGDPSCVWREGGAAPERTTLISDPTDPASTTTATTPAPTVVTSEPTLSPTLSSNGLQTTKTYCVANRIRCWVLALIMGLVAAALMCLGCLFCMKKCQRPPRQVVHEPVKQREIIVTEPIASPATLERGSSMEY